MDRPLDLSRAADERIDPPGRGALDQVHRERAERVAERPRALVLVRVRVVGLLRLRSPLRDLRDAVRDVAHRVEPRDALLGEEVGRLRVGLAEDRDQHVAPVDLLASRRLHVGGRPLEDALEAERLLRGAVPSLRRPLLRIEPGAQVGAEPLHVAPAGADHLDDRVVVEECGEHVFDANELVAFGAGVADRLGEARFEAPAEPHQSSSSSTLQRSGNSCARAIASTFAARVSATSRV